MISRKKIILLLLLPLCSLWTMAQELTVKGTVKDDSGLELLGASIVVKGTTKGVAADGEGHYEIKVKNGDILVFSSMGYTSQERKVTKAGTINIVLSSDVQQLEGTDVVAVAYGTTDKKSFTGSMATIKAENITQRQSADVAKTLEGAVSGVQISNSSGDPGAGSAIRIRGIGSIYGSSAPLIILDGAPYHGSLNSINNSDIESLNVLKDASSAALYGARGANGVIIITTKSGKRDKLSITVDARTGFNTRGIPEYDKISSTSEYYETLYNSLYNKSYFTQTTTNTTERYNTATAWAADNLIKNVGNGYNIYDVPDDQLVLPNGKLNPNAKLKYKDANFNDWEKALFKPGIRDEYNLSLTKGNESNSFYFSFGYLGDEGYNLNSYFNRYSSRFSYKGDVTQWLKANASTMLTYTEKQGTEYSGTNNPFEWTRFIAPIYPIFEHDANGYPTNKYDFGGARKFNGNTNPVATQKHDILFSKNYYLNQSLSLDINLLKNLTFSTSGNFYANFYNSNEFTTPLGGYGKDSNGIGSRYSTHDVIMTFNQLLKYNQSWGNYSFDVLLGHESNKERYASLSGGKKNFLDPLNSEFDNAAVTTSLGSSTTGYFVEGYFGQLNMNYDYKYFLSTSLRRDASSVFAPENRWGTFWSVGGSWLVNREKFLEKVSFINSLKLKASYGIQGNDYLFLPGGGRSYAPYLNLYYVTTDGTKPGLQAGYKGNRKITWEESGNFNTGIEADLWDNRLSIEADFFVKTTKNMLFNMPLPASTGFSSEPRNVADMQNKGVEFSISVTPVRTENVEWQVTANGMWYNNKVLKLPEELREKGLAWGGQQIIKEGGSIYDFYMVKYGGVDPETGDALFWTYTKTTSSDAQESWNLLGSDKYNYEKSKQFVGTSIPDLQGGFGTSLRVYNIDLSVQFSYQIGGKFYDYQYSSLMGTGDLGRNWHTDIRKRWTPENRNTDVPRLEFAGLQGSSSDRFLVSASYLSLRNVSIGYNVPQEAAEKLKLSSIRYYVTGDNLYLWSYRKGLDPRASLSGNGSDRASYSPIRTISMGLTLNF